MRRSFGILLACFALGLPACGGAGEVGDACSNPGVNDQCVDGAVCHDRNSGDSPGVCRQRCSDDTDCAGGGSCEDVSEVDGDVKGCI